jgi:hypothetical protein
MSGPPPVDDNPLTDTAREVTSGPKCPLCGFPMEPGFLGVELGSPALVLAANPNAFSWHDPEEGSGRPGDLVDAVSSTHLLGRPWLKGARCPECKYVELRY